MQLSATCCSRLTAPTGICTAAVAQRVATVTKPRTEHTTRPRPSGDPSFTQNHTANPSRTASSALTLYGYTPIPPIGGLDDPNSTLLNPLFAPKPPPLPAT